MQHTYGRFCRPELVSLLEALTLDAVYERADGNYLWQRRDGALVKVLDLVGGFGANLFGHYHPELVAEERRLTELQVPLLAQGSIRTGAGRLAEALAHRLGDYVSIITNTGTETVEAALKHARLERERSVVWAVSGAFHGKTLGSVQLTDSYRAPYAGWGPSVRFLDPDNSAEWDAAAAEADQVAAAFVEPILGEGGVRPISPRFIEWLIGVRAQAGFPIVVDEIQTGLGRTGTFLASESVLPDPDYILLSKAIGGGLAKLGVLLIQRKRFQPEFSLTHTSTFAEDDRGCEIALKALEILDRDDLMRRCARRGEYLLDRLAALQKRFSDQIKEVRGRGLMIGVELMDQSGSPSSMLRTISQHDYLGYLAAAYFLNEHQIRIAPTLSHRSTLRLEPSAYITEAELDRFLTAFESLCLALEMGDASHLTAFQVGKPAPPIEDRRGWAGARREVPRGERRVAFIGHLLRPEDVWRWDPALAGIPADALELLMAKTGPKLGATVFEEINVESRTGMSVHLSYIGLGFTPGQAMSAIRDRDGWILDAIEDAVALARDRGCLVVGLGGYTSILTGNCRRVKTGGIALTSGNSLTVGMGLTALRKAAAWAGIDLNHATLGIFGATGNIASTAAALLAPHVAGLVLVVRDARSPRFKAVMEQVRAAAPDVPIEAATTPDALRGCSLILAASNQPDPGIFPEHLGPEPVVICDISLPTDVAPSVTVERPDVVVIAGGVMKLPRNEDFTIAGLVLDPGHVYACLAETLLMGFEGATSHGSYGPVTPDGVRWTIEAAERHGFRIAQLKMQPV